MNKTLQFADRKPFLFVLAVLLVWILLGSIFAVLAAALLSAPVASLVPQAAGALIATMVLLLGAARIGWIDGIGIARLGSRSAWFITFIVGAYVLLVNSYAFFGEITFQPAALFSPEALPIYLRALQAGFVEEVLFRGIVLYGLVRIWGKSNRGLVAALVVQALLFGLLHALQAFVGVDLPGVVSNIFKTFIFGLWVGALVVIAGTIWPAIVLHAVSNSFILVKGLSSPWMIPNYLGYLRGALFELPLVLLGLLIVLKINSDESITLGLGAQKFRVRTTD